MFEYQKSSRPILQRRSRISNTVQAMLDGLAIIGVSLGLLEYNFDQLGYEYTLMLLLLLGIVAVVYDRYALYRNNTNFTLKMLTMFKAWTLSFLILLLLGFLTKQIETFSRLVMAEIYILGYATQVMLHLLVRLTHRSLMQHAHHPNKVIIVGQGRLANYLQHKIANNPWMGEQVVGEVSLDNDLSTSRKPGSTDSPTLLGGLDDLPALINQHGIRTVYIVTPLESSGSLEKIYFLLLDDNVTIHWIPDIFSLRLINHSVKEIAGIPVLTLSETPLTGISLLVKSVEDIVLSSLLLLIVSPVLLVVALAIKLDSPGTVFFRQNRAGWNGKIFRIWKFRSMYVHQPKNGVVKQAEKDDPRITPVGKFLRKTSLDELPQLLNVLTGDMSLVGPRPHAVQHDEEYSRRISDYFARHNIKPGITGLAQVRGFRGETKELDQMILRVESDIEYINNWSLWLDLTILVRTTTALTSKNAY